MIIFIAGFLTKKSRNYL